MLAVCGDREDYVSMVSAILIYCETVPQATDKTKWGSDGLHISVAEILPPRPFLQRNNFLKKIT